MCLYKMFFSRSQTASNPDIPSKTITERHLCSNEAPLTTNTHPHGVKQPNLVCLISVGEHIYCQHSAEEGEKQYDLSQVFSQMYAEENVDVHKSNTPEGFDLSLCEGFWLTNPLENLHEVINAGCSRGFEKLLYP